VFPSGRRPIVFPQADHARFSAAIALAWGNDDFPRPPLPFGAFVRGVALHDRGYAELDNDPQLQTPRDRWIEIQRNGFRPRGVEPIVDLIVGRPVCPRPTASPPTPSPTSATASRSTSASRSRSRGRAPGSRSTSTASAASRSTRGRSACHGLSAS
jgi:hypothetical protein